MKYGKSEIKYISLLWIGWCAMNVRGILFFILILCEVMAVQGSSNRVNLPREGDVLEMHKIDFVDTISCGKDCLWDLSSSNVSGKVKLSFTSEGKDSISCIVGRTRYKFRISGDTLYDVGFENNLSGMDFIKGEILLISPISYGQTHSGKIQGYGRYTDMRNHEMRGGYQNSTKARGVLITPDGDTIPNVIRLTSDRWSKSIYTPIDSISVKQRSDSVLLRLKTSRWYVKGYRYPMLIERVLYSEDGSLLLRNSRYIKLSSLENISDVYNEELRDQEELQKEIVKQQNQKSSSLPESDFDYVFSQDKSTSTITIRYESSDPIDVEFVLTDINGIVYDYDCRRCIPEESSSITFSYGHLPINVASYGVNIRTSTGVYSEKFYR